MPQVLIDFWAKADLDDFPLVHPEDKNFLDLKKCNPRIKSLETYIEAFRQSCFKPNQPCLSLLPQPYFGRIKEAKVVILLANPGLSASDFYLEENHPEFGQAIRDTIRTGEQKHLSFDTKWTWTGGFGWWEAKLRAIAEIVAKEFFSGDYGLALDLLSEEISCLEIVPYHSRSFTGFKNLPSSQAAKAAAAEIARDRSRLVIVARQAKNWDLTCEDNVVVYGSGQARYASLGLNSEGGTKILEVLRASMR